MAVRVKREPGSNGTSAADGSAGTPQRICFVCGGNKAAYMLSSRPRERGGSYFPFLEQHEVPHGARRPNSEGDVAACMLCHSFLNQQWEMYEKGRTPHVKRLYWLKRSDNGHYIGADMAQQGDYASQVIGVSPEPGAGGQHGHCGTAMPAAARSSNRGGGPSSSSSSHHVNNRGASTPHLASEEYYGRSDSNAFPYQPAVVATSAAEDSYGSPAGLLDLRGGRTPGVSPRSSSSSKCRDAGGEQGHNHHRKPEFPLAHSAPNGALDLSMPDKNAASEACYLCGDEVLRSTLVNAYAKPVSNCPFFPSLMLHPRPSRSRPMDSNGCVQACKPCYQYLLQQWDMFQRQSVPHSDRRYQLWKQGSPAAAAPPSSIRPPRQPSPRSPQQQQQQPPPDFICFLCGREFQWNLRHILYAGTNPEGEPPLPFLERVKPARGSTPLSAAGQALACSECYRAVHRQRHAYMDSLRTALIEEAPPQPPRVMASHHHPKPAARDYEPQPPHHSRDASCLTCHVCRQVVPRQHLKFAEALPDKDGPGQGFFPSAVQDDGDGFPVCLQCYGALLAQWESFEEDRIPYHQRRYFVPPPSQLAEPPSRKVSTASRPGSDGGVHHEMALRIRVPSPEQDHTTAHGAPLLTTVSAASDSPVARGNALDLSGGSLVRGAPRPSASSSPMPLAKATALAGGAVVVCFICGLQAQGSRARAVRAFPQKQIAVDGAPEATPFFPFLTLHPAPPDAEPVSEDGVALACTFCYHSLMVQWTAYEAAPASAAAGPWARAYNCHDYVCYVCGVTTYRKRVKAISVADFPFLVQHPRPPGSLVLDGGDGVVVCLMCYETLSSQWNDFERMKVPLELRKYNWIAAPPPPEEDEPPPTITGAPLVNGDSPSDYQKPIVIDDDDDDEDEEMGLPAPGRRISRQETPPQQMPVNLNGHYGAVAALHPPRMETATSGYGPLGMLVRGRRMLDPVVVAGNGYGSTYHLLAGEVPFAHSRMTTANGLAYHPGLVHGSSGKPPPLTPSVPQQANCNQKQMSRSHGVVAATAAPPLSQMSPNSVAAAVSGSQARTSSFAAALRKLAEQAIEPCDKDMTSLSPIDSPCSTPTPKRVPPSLVHSSAVHPSSAHSHPAPSNFSSPPVVSSAAPAPAHGGFVDGRKGLDRPASSQARDMAKGSYEDSRKSGLHSNHRHHADMSREDSGRGSSSQPYADGRRDADLSPAKGFLATSQASEGMGTKGGGTSSGYYVDGGRDEHGYVVNGMSTSQQLQHMRSRQSSAGGSLPRLENPAPSHLSAAGSGFHPYRSPSEDARHGLPQHVPPAYEQTSPYGYHPAAFLPHHMSHPSFRLDDQLYLERYGLLRSPMFPMPHPGLPTHHGMPSFMAGARYPTELLPHHLGLVSSTGHLLAQERIKLEEQQQRREIEMEIYQEQERRRERDREREREREKEREWERETAGETLMLGRGQQQDGKGYQKPPPSSWSHSRSSESPVRPGAIGSITQGTPRDLVIHTSSTQHQQPSCSPGPPMAKPPSATQAPPSWNSGHYYPYATREQHLEMAESHLTASAENVTNKLFPLVSHHHDRSSPSSERDRPPRDSGGMSGGGGTRGIHETAERGSSSSRPSSLLSFLPHSQKLRSSSPTSHHQPHHAALDPASVQERTTTGGKPLATEPSGRRVSVIMSEAQAPQAANHERIFSREQRQSKPPAVVVAPGRNHSNHITVDVEDSVPWCSRYSPSLSAPALLPVTASTDGYPPSNVNAVVAAVPQECRTVATVVSNGLKSKLDLAAERARLRNGDEASEDEDADDESRWSRLLVIASGPPLPLDQSKKKLSFFAYFGLTTQKKKRELELDKIVRRQKKLRDPTLPSLEGIPGYTTHSTLWFLSSSARCPSSSLSDAYSREPLKPEKVQFLRSLDLDPMPRIKREEHEQILRVVIEEKIKRNGHSRPNHYKALPSYRNEDRRATGSLNSEFEDLVNKCTKRKRDQNEIPSTSGGREPPKRAKSLLANSRKKIANLPARRPSDAAPAGQSLLPIVSGPIIKRAREQSESNAETTRTEDPSSFSSGAGQLQMYGRDFAQEFHESVLLQTQLKSRASTVKKVEWLPEKAAAAVVCGPPEDRAPSPHSSVHVHHKTHHYQLRWPAIEVLMEAYKRHEQEQNLEKEVLSEQCSRLKTQNRDLNGVVEKLTQSMANLIHIKKGLDEERHCHHQAIDNLKHILKRLR